MISVLVASLLAVPMPGNSASGDAVATFTGVLDPSTLPSFCQEETHFLACNGALIKSSSMDLTPFEGQVFKFDAVLRGVECDIWDVTAVSTATATLETCGSPLPGCPVRFRVGPTGVIGQYFLYGSTATTFAPLGSTLGTLLIEPPGFFLGDGPTSGSGSTVDVSIPSSLGLVGLKLWFQGGRFDVGPVGPIELTNAVCFTIGPPSPPCVNPDC